MPANVGPEGPFRGFVCCLMMAAVEMAFFILGLPRTSPAVLL